MIYDSSGVARLAGWAVLVWLAARAKQQKVGIAAIDWLACHPGDSVCVCWWGVWGGVFCLCVHPSIVNCSTDSSVSGASQPLSAELINRLRLRTYVGVCHSPTSLFGCVCFRVLGERVCLCMHRFISSFFFQQAFVLLNCFLPPPVPDSTCCCGCRHIPQFWKVAIQVLSLPIKSVLKCVKFQAITRRVRNKGNPDQQFVFMSQRVWERYKCISWAQDF